MRLQLYKREIQNVIFYDYNVGTNCIKKLEEKLEENLNNLEQLIDKAINDIQNEGVYKNVKEVIQLLENKKKDQLSHEMQCNVSIMMLKNSLDKKEELKKELLNKKDFFFKLNNHFLKFLNLLRNLDNEQNFSIPNWQINNQEFLEMMKPYDEELKKDQEDFLKNKYVQYCFNKIPEDTLKLFYKNFLLDLLHTEYDFTVDLRYALNNLYNELRKWLLESKESDLQIVKNERDKKSIINFLTGFIGFNNNCSDELVAANIFIQMIQNHCKNYSITINPSLSLSPQYLLQFKENLKKYNSDEEAKIFLETTAAKIVSPNAFEVKQK